MVGRRCPRIGYSPGGSTLLILLHPDVPARTGPRSRRPRGSRPSRDRRAARSTSASVKSARADVRRAAGTGTGRANRIGRCGRRGGWGRRSACRLIVVLVSSARRDREIDVGVRDSRCSSPSRPPRGDRWCTSARQKLKPPSKLSAVGKARRKAVAAAAAAPRSHGSCAAAVGGQPRSEHDQQRRRRLRRRMSVRHRIERDVQADGVAVRARS